MRTGNRERSPYLAHPRRLADVVAALQVMGTYKFASREPERWGKAIGRAPLSAAGWEALFSDHPEFFRVHDGLADLVWRRAGERTFDTETGRTLPQAEAAALPASEQAKLSRAPLDAGQVEALVNSAVSMHDRAIAHSAETRWWIPLAVGFGGALLGALLGALAG